MSYIDEIVSVSIKNKGCLYRRSIPKLDFSIERYTDLVPSDGKFYILHKGQILRSYRSRNKAIEYFYQFIKESKYELSSMPTKVDEIAEKETARYFRKHSTFF